MTAITVPHAGRCRRDEGIDVWFMTDERPRRRGAAGWPRHAWPCRLRRAFFGPGRRAGRGDMRAAILALLAEEPMHGYQIIQVISERSGGNWTPSPGSVYPTLQQLEDEGLIEPAPSESGRRVYALTEAGRAARPRTAPRARGRRPQEDVDDDLVELRDLVHQVLAATRQVAQAGTAAQVKGAQDVLRTARKGIYRLLADDELVEVGVGGLGPGRRAGRGDIRAAILALLAEEPMHGYQMIQVISERSGGNWTPSPGSVYPTLQQLEDEGLIEPAASNPGGASTRSPRPGRTANAADDAAGAVGGGRAGRRRRARRAPRSRPPGARRNPAGRAGRHRRPDQGRPGRAPRRAQGHLPPARRGRAEA